MNNKIGKKIRENNDDNLGELLIKTSMWIIVNVEM